MKSYVALIAGLTFVGVSVVHAADDGATKSMDTAATEQQSAMGALNTMDPDKLEGMDIFDSANEQIGDVDEVVVDKDGKRMIVIGLEDDMKEVVVPLDELTMGPNEDRLMIKMTRDELMALPDYDPMDMESADE